MATSSPVGLTSTGPQVFINFRGSDMRNSFIGFLVTALRNANINVFTDRDEVMGRSLQNLLVRIEESKLAIAIFSQNYASSVWCLDELVKINECVDQGGLIAIPIFYKIEPSTVKHLEGKFGDAFRAQRRHHLHEPEKTQKWEEALTSIPRILGSCLHEKSDLSEEDFIKGIVEGVQRSLTSIFIRENPLVDLNLKENQSREIVGYESKKDPTLPEVYSEFEICARKLEITNSDNPKKWAWSFICDASTNYHNIEIVTMKKVHLLEIRGSFDTSDLSPGTAYEVFFVVRLEGSESGWKDPVYLTLEAEHHDGNKSRQKSEVKLANYLGQGWVNIRAGALVAPDANAAANVYFSMTQLDFQRKGLVVQGVDIRPIR